MRLEVLSDDVVLNGILIKLFEFFISILTKEEFKNVDEILPSSEGQGIITK